jgi:NAD+ kinase
LKIAIYSRGIEPDQMHVVQSLFGYLGKNQVTPLIWKPFFNQVKDNLHISTEFRLFNEAAELDNSADCLISLGGDGTLLDTVTLVGNKNIPILGINFGRLGFLAGVSLDELESAIDSLVNHTHVIEERTLIHADSDQPIFGNTPYGLNEFAIHKKDTSPMIHIRTYLNGEFLSVYWADGLIVSTPTGSTGYSLSCGGPIVFPDSGSFVITPVAPHNLNIRPIIVPDTNIISFEVEGRTDQFICALDSRREIVPRTTQIAVRKEDFSIRLIRLSENNFLQTLRNKLSWGLDKRN